MKLKVFIPSLIAVVTLYLGLRTRTETLHPPQVEFKVIHGKSESPKVAGEENAKETRAIPPPSKNQETGVPDTEHSRTLEVNVMEIAKTSLTPIEQSGISRLKIKFPKQAETLATLIRLKKEDAQLNDDEYDSVRANLVKEFGTFENRNFFFNDALSVEASPVIRSAAFELAKEVALEGAQYESSAKSTLKLSTTDSETIILPDDTAELDRAAFAYLYSKNKKRPDEASTKELRESALALAKKTKGALEIYFNTMAGRLATAEAR